MVIRNQKELFVTMLSAVREGTERTAKILHEFSQVVQNPEIKEALEARVFVKDKILSTLDQAFNLIDEQPVKVTGHLLDALVDDFRHELAEIQSPEARRLFVLAKVSQLAHIRIGEYAFLTAAADLTANWGVGVLLDSCLSDDMALLERMRRQVRSVVETKAAAKAASNN
jgi:ferritin-like metal-binding protein YciE